MSMMFELLRNRPALRLAVLATLGSLHSLLGAAGLLAEETPPNDAAAPTSSDAEFFERRVRPLLVNHCFECHGPKEQEAGLRLDSRAAVLRGGDGGKIIVPGDVKQSRLLEVLGYQGEIQMPPDEKLSDAQIGVFAQWVQQGAPWPGSDDKPRTGPMEPGDASLAGPGDYERLREHHWSYQPLSQVEPPEVASADATHSPIDRFVMARLEAAGLKLSPAADRYTLLRRATYDLIGLSPTAEEVEAFEQDTRPDAFARIVDRLLASPHYGERWGRYWLDVARYADTKGYVFTQEPRYAYSYTYRDYVIRALNEDLPFDRFVLEQLAADQLVSEGDDPRPLAALGYLTLGRRFSNNTHDIIDDRIDVVTRGLLGLTVTCARCHDHKYDPITMADYYGLYGVFNSCQEPGELPLIAQPQETEKYQAFQQEQAVRQAAVDSYIDQQRQRIEDELRTSVGDYLVYVVAKDPDKLVEKGVFLSLSPGEIKPKIVSRWRKYLADHARPDDAVFGPWARLAALPRESFAQAAADFVAQQDAATEEPTDAKVNRLVIEALRASPPTSMQDVARVYGNVLEGVQQQWKQMVDAPEKAATVATAGSGSAPSESQPEAPDPKPPATPPAKPTALEDAAAEALRQVLYGENAPTRVDRDDLRGLLERDRRNELTKRTKHLQKWQATSPDAPPRAMVLVDKPQPVAARIFLRGNPARPGDETPRRFLSVLTDPEAETFTQGSGRLELARAIVDEANPLTARVMVNRVWQFHFGQGLVRTPSDFGVRGDRPTHPELLDYLAITFREQGWSLKTLHRRIMLSAVYQQASDHRPDRAEVDPENRLLWRAHRRRLAFEPLRDSLLAAAGRLDPASGGKSVDLFAEPYSTRRAIYGFIDRQDLPGVLRVFDFASPDASTAQRSQTTVPQQALFLMNSPFVQQQAHHVALHAMGDEAADDTQRVQRLYRRIFARAARPAEVELALRFVQSATAAQVSAPAENQPPTAGESPSPTDSPASAEASQKAATAGASLAAWEQLAQSLMLTNEFVFVD
jgi:cytochrome c551/c552